jgi:ATP-dependent protease HslVU (ClpYQ) peptidase subunit
MKEEKGGITIGYDSQLTAGMTKTNSSMHKVIKNGDLVLGVAGELRVYNAIKFTEFEKVGPDPERWASTYLADKLFEISKKIPHDKDDSFNYSTLVVAGGQVFIVDKFCSVMRAQDGFHSIGSGSEWAMGALAAGASVKKALKIAARFDSGTGGTLHVTTAAALLGTLF